MKATPPAVAALWCGGALLLAAAVAPLRPLLPVDETRYMTVAWEMWRSGDLLVPHLNGVPYADKPPVLFWLVQLAWSLGGVSTWAARLVPLAAGAAIVAAVARLAALLWPARPGLPSRAALLAAGSGLLLFFATLVRFDLLVAACAAWAFVGLARARRDGGPGGWTLVALALGLGLLAKGPVVLSVVLPAALLAPLWLDGRPPRGWAGWYLGLLAAVAGAAAIGLAWALPAAAHGGEAYGASLLWGQTANRVVGARDHAQPVWFYAAVLPVLALPWLLWPPLWRGAAAAVRRPLDEGSRALLVAAAGALVVMSAVSAKQIHYLMPLVPLLALLAARVSDDGGDAPGLGPVAGLLVALGLLGLLAPVAAPLVGLGTPWPGRVAAAGPAVLVAGGATLRAAARWGRLDGPRGLLAATAIVLAGVHLGAAPRVFPRYDLTPAAGLLAAHQHAGLAWGHDVAGEFGYLGRLEVPVEEVAPAAMAAWLADHPGGAAALHYRDRPAAPAVSPAVEWPYRATTLGVWLGP